MAAEQRNESSAARIYPARDPFPPPPAVKRAAEKGIKRATVAVAAIKEAS